MNSAAESLRKKGVIDFGPFDDVHLKVRPSEAFRIAISPTTNPLETLIVYFTVGLVIMDNRFSSDLHDFDRAIYESLEKGGMARAPGVILEPTEPGLSERVLKRLISLEERGLI